MTSTDAGPIHVHVDSKISHVRLVHFEFELKVRHEKHRQIPVLPDLMLYSICQYRMQYLLEAPGANHSQELSCRKF